MYMMSVLIKDDDWRQYEEGMVVTVEPGLYIAPDDETVDKNGVVLVFVLKMMWSQRQKAHEF